MVDGRVDAEVVAELEQVVARVAGPVCLDLTGLRSVDEAGLGLLQRLCAHGVGVIGASTYFRLLLGLEEPDRAREPPPRPGGRKRKGERGPREP
jgi:STAS domain-containing protein